MRSFLIRLLLAAHVALALMVSVHVPVAVAQETIEKIDYAEWEAVAQRAEEAIDKRLASNEAFESLRSEVVVWRDRFLRAQDANAARIKTLQAQIEALGAPPAEGEAEAPELAERRKNLNTQLAEARAPVKTAEEAFSRADGLAREIDEIIRARQTDVLLTLAPTPLNPALWPETLRDVTASLRAIATESATAWESDAKRATFREALPRTLLFVVIAVFLLARGRAVMERMTGLVLDRFIGRARGVMGFVTSLGQIVVPVVGIILLVEALQSTGLFGLRGQLLIGMLPWFGIYLFGARWLGLRLFPKRSDVPLPFEATREQGRSMRLAATLLGLLLGVRMVLDGLAAYESYPDASTGVLLLPVKVLIALVLLRISRVLIAIARREHAEEKTDITMRGLMLIGRATAALAVVGVAMAAIGYLNAGAFLLVPTVFTLAMLGILLLINQLIRDIYAFATGCDHDQARAALIPTLIYLLFVLASLPAFALFWGARVADLTELWAKFREGFTLGETRISPENFLTFAMVFVALYVATRLLQGALRNTVLPKTNIDTGGQTAIVSGVGYIGIILAAMIAISTAGIDLSSLAFVAGALSIGIGFGLQNIVQNFVSGIILLIERPVAEGDWIQVGGHTGTVRKISVRSTLVETFDRTDVIVPNGDFIAGAVTNWTRTNSIGRIKVPVGVAYGSDTRRVAEILMEIAQEHPLVTINPEPGVDFLGFGADSLDFQIRAVLRDVNFSLSVKTEMNHRIAERFAEEGIEIPFAQRDIWLRNPEALSGASKPADQSAPSSDRDLKLTDNDRELDPSQMDIAEGDTT